MRVYISGKIGEGTISEKTRKKFQHAALVLKNRHHEVFDPTDEEWQRELGKRYPIDMRWEDRKIDFYRYVLLRDLMVIATCDAILLLADWRDSQGAKTELAFARAAGLEVMELTEYGEVATWK